MKVLFLFFGVCSIIELVFGHGRFTEPPSRSTAWRYGFNTPRNYNDHELFCGGFVIQWGANGGRCGTCGDRYDGPRHNELPDGVYAKNLVVTRNYKRGSVIKAQVQLTANHWGYFEFKLCPATTMKVEVTQECLDKNVLEVLNSKDKFKYILTVGSPQMFDIELKLPNDITCDRCVLQWTYTTGNRWGKCEDGTSKNGCGPQETFRACSDVSIDGTGSSQPPTTKKPITTTTTAIPTITTKKPDSNKPKGKCHATDAHKSIPNIDSWCATNCAIGYCPEEFCTCS